MATAPAQQVQLMTAEDLMEMETGDGLRYELIGGVLHTMAAGGGRHGLIAATLLAQVLVFAEVNGLGRVFAAETGFLLQRGPDTVRAPDVAFVRGDRVPADLNGYPPLAPDLVAEVVSPTDRPGMVVAKARAWLQAGVLVVWVVEPRKRTVTVYRPGSVTVLHGSNVLREDDVLPGFALPLPELLV